MHLNCCLQNFHPKAREIQTNFIQKHHVLISQKPIFHTQVQNFGTLFLLKFVISKIHPTLKGEYTLNQSQARGFLGCKTDRGSLSDYKCEIRIEKSLTVWF